MSKCEHGVYDPHGNQQYCSVCNPIPIDAALVKSVGASAVGKVGVLKDQKVPAKVERKWEDRLEKKLLGKKQLALEEPGESATLASARKDIDDYTLLRKKFDGDEGFLDGHQIVKIRSREREAPEWTASNAEIQKLLLRVFPKLLVDENQKKAAARWAMVINLFYRMSLTYSQVGEEVGISEDAVMKIIQRANRARSGVVNSRGRPKKT